MMKSKKIHFSMLIALLIVFIGVGVGHAVTYSKHFDDPNVGLRRTQTFNFSNGFDTRAFDVSVDTVLNNGTITFTFTTACQAGNANPSPEAFCAALNLQPGQSGCSDTNPNTNCNAGDQQPFDAPADAPDSSETYRITIPAVGSSLIQVEVKPAVGVAPNVNVVTGGGGGGVTVSPNFIQFNTATTNTFSFSILNANAKMNLLQNWSWSAYANAENDGPGESQFQGTMEPPPPPSLVCNYKHVNGSADLNLPNAQSFPVDVTVEVSLTNGPVAQVLTIVDTLPNANWVYKGPTNSIPAGTVPAAPSIAGQDLTWVTPAAVPANTTVTFTFLVTLNNEGAVPAGGCVFNSVAMSGAQGGTSNCQARVCRGTTPGKVPGLNEGGAILLTLVLAASAIWLLRRKRSIG